VPGIDLEGFATKSLDEKNRVGLPSRHTRVLSGEIVLCPGAPHCIEARSLSEWEDFKSLLMAAAARGPKQRRELLRHMVGHSVHVRIDGQGRVRVNGELLEWAGVPTEHGSNDRELKIIGMGQYLELWSCAAYEARRQTGEADFEETLDEVLHEQLNESPAAAGSDGNE